MYKQDFLKSREGVEMVSSLFSQIISNKITDPSISSVIIKIVKFDPLLSPKDLNEHVEMVADIVNNYQSTHITEQLGDLSNEKLIQEVQSILKDIQLDYLGSVVPLYD